MRQITYKITIGSEVFDTDNQDLLTLSIDLDMYTPADSFKIALKPGTRAGKLKNGDPVVLELGYAGTNAKVVTGTVDTVESKVD